MKKFSIIVLLFFVTITLLGCNNEVGEVFLSAPVNVRIIGDKLSWDEVEDAKSYIVYEDGVEVDTVKKNEYTFNDDSTSMIIFTVRAEAPRGSEDSPMSLQIAFVPNYQEEVDAINDLMDDLGMDMPPLFAEELVSRGMLEDELSDMMDDLEEISYDFYEYGDSSYTSTLHLFNSMIQETDNYEAILAAVVISYIPVLLQTEIDDLNEKASDLTGYIVDNHNYNNIELLTATRDEYLKTIAMYQSIIDQMETTPDVLILALCETVDYLTTMIDYASTNLLNSLDQLIGLDDKTDATSLELSQMLEELQTLFEETKPSMEALVVIASMEQFLYLSLSEEESPIDNIENLYGKRAYQLSLSIDAFTQFLDNIDEDYITKMMENALLSNSVQCRKETLILNAEYLNQYLNVNEELLDDLMDVFSMEEQEYLFKTVSFSESSLNIDSDFTLRVAVLMGAVDTLTFTDFYNAKFALKDYFEVFVEEIATDDTFIERYVDYNEYVDLSLYDPYNSETSSEFERSVLESNLYEEFYRIIEVANKSLNKDEFLSLASIFSNTLIQFSLNRQYSSPSKGLPLLTDLFQSLIEEYDTEIFAIFKDWIVYLNDENYYSSLATIYNSYPDTEEYETYSFRIKSIKNYLAIDVFLTTKRITLFEDIIDMIIIGISEEDFKDEFELSTEDIQTIETNLDRYLELLSTANEELGDIDLMNLDSSGEYTCLMYEAELNQALSNIFKILYDLTYVN